MAWGTLQIGGLLLKELDVLTDATNANTGERAVRVEGSETVPGATLAAVESKQEDVMGLIGRLVPVIFQRKALYNGYYLVTDTNAEYEKWVEGPAQVRWSLAMEFVGTEGQVDIESRLANVVRLNDFALTGERWHAPAIGHYAYQTGSTVPSFVARTGADGVMNVYRAIPAATNPRWGATAPNYLLGRVRLLQGAIERTGVGVSLTATGWEVNNALVRIKPAVSGTSTFTISAWTGGAWRDKDWDMRFSGTTVLPASNVLAVTVLRNDPEMVVLRLVVQMASDSSRRLVDISLRRGSRFVEGYVQVAAGSTIAMTPDVAETATDNHTTGWMRATSNDAAGNRFVVGSARTFATETNGGIQKAATTTLDFFVGVEAGGSGAVSGDQGLDLRNQYIGAMAEKVGVARR